MLMQLMEDVLGALMPPTSKQDEWYTGALGILNGGGVQALGRVPGMLHAAAYRQLRDEGRYGTASGIPEAERYQRHDGGGVPQGGRQ